MIYLSGVADHKIDNDKIIDHIVRLVENKILELKNIKYKI
jgi:hypothetical protein